MNEIKLVTAKEVIDEARIRFGNFNNLTKEELDKTIGGINGIDMVTYKNGYTDALSELITFFETRV